MSKSSKVTSDQVPMWAKQEEALKTQALEAVQTDDTSSFPEVTIVLYRNIYQCNMPIINI